MSYSILTVPPFEKQLKKLYKKYPSIKGDLKKLAEELIENPTKGTSLGNNCYKIRIAIASKGKGRSGGARIITHIHVQGTAIYLLYIYDKSDKANITDKEIKELLEYI